MMNCVDVGGNRAGHSNQIDRDYDQDIKLGGPIAKDQVWFFGTYRASSTRWRSRASSSTRRSTRCCETPLRVTPRAGTPASIFTTPYNFVDAGLAGRLGFRPIF